jgi:DNA polymerase (family 10)
MTKNDIIAILEEMGTLLELQGGNPFKARAFHNASRAVEGITQDIEEMTTSGALLTVKGIGKSIARVITDLITAGKSKDYEEIKASVPAGVLEMLKIQGLGPKKVKALDEKLKISGLTDLEEAAKSGRLEKLAGFGKKTGENILQSIQALRNRGEKSLYLVAAGAAEMLLADIRKERGVVRSAIAGSIRRRKELIGDIDILVSASENARLKIMERFTTHPHVKAILAHGETKSSVVLRQGINCDLRIVADTEFPFALNYSTGSKEHNVEMRSRARKAGLSLNEYAFTPLTVEALRGNGARVPSCSEEADIYQALGLSYIEPELRENMGEFEAAENGTLPNLLKEADIKGTLHCHTTYSDGVNTLEQMVDAARGLQWKYLGIADHSRGATYASGLSIDQVKEQVREIEGLNERLRGIRVFKGTECDILPNGSLDWPEAILALFDYVIISVHTNFKMSKSDMTKRIIRALKNKHVTLLGHPTGRLLLTRDAYPVDMRQVIDAAADYGKGIEINAHPTRMDLDWRLCRYARDKGVNIFINPDAHSIDGLREVLAGVGIARKGWLEARHVVNTWPVERVASLLESAKD